MGVVIDRFGLFGVDEVALTWPRALGVAPARDRRRTLALQELTGTAAPASVETQHGRANVHLHPADEPIAALVLGHGAGGGVAAPDLARRDARRARSRRQRRARRAALPRRRPPLACARAPARRAPGRKWSSSCARRAFVACRSSSAAAPRAHAWPAAPRLRPDAVGVLCLAFPLQPPPRSGSPASPSRLPELDAVSVPLLVVQGARDRFGIPTAGALRTVVQVPGDHGLKTDLEAVAAAVRAWLPGIVAQAASS